MDALINTSYYGFTQLLVPVVLLIFGSRVRPGVMAAGLAGGATAAIVLYAVNADFGGLSLGVPALSVNVLVVCVGRLLWPRAVRSRAVWAPSKSNA